MVRLVTDFSLCPSAESVDTVESGDTNVWRSRSKARTAKGRLPFVVWDGEGANVPDVKKQCYVLLGYYDGENHYKISPKPGPIPRLTTEECLEFIIESGIRNPNVWNVSFAFNYDAVMILSDLSAAMLKRLHKRNTVWYKQYRIEFYPSKWLRITRRKNGEKNVTVTIEDTFGFFQTSLVSALKANLQGHPLMENLPEIEAGKDRRSKFTANDWHFIVKYWEIENQLFHALIERLYENMYDPRVNLRIRKWYGPGALASYVYKTRGIMAHKAECGDEIYDAARFAYAGGRFEMFHCGRAEKVYGYDINSAYPYAISQLPSLSQGHWEHVENPTEIARFGVYRVHMILGLGANEKTPGPFFHRDKDGNVTFPWQTLGWYWSPEVETALHVWRERHGDRPDTETRFLKVLEGWVFVEDDPTLRPFAFVEEMYAQRKRLKDEGEGAQMALKLALNSLYGKMAQRAGWERSGKAPTWHQLEWAGWVTSKTRATLYELMWRIGYERLIAVETDGLYTTATPEELGITHSKELGGWEVTFYDEMTYYQSGIYVKLSDGKWSSKYRGLDPKSVPLDELRSHVEKMEVLQRGESWPPIIGTNTRFVGLGAAIARAGDNDFKLKASIGKWETKEAVIGIGEPGSKRVHKPTLCLACQDGESAYYAPHEMVINSIAQRFRKIPDAEHSQRHDIPWLDPDKAAWRLADEIEKSLYRWDA